jgi:hypothetical protein
MRVLLILPILFIPNYLYAYIGPGLGIGAIAIFLGLILALVLSIFSVVAYPIRKILNKKKNDNKSDHIDS